MGHNHYHCQFCTLRDRAAPVFFSYHCFLVTRADNVELIFKDLHFTRFILKLGSKKTLEWLVKKVGIREKNQLVRIVHAYLPLIEEFIWQLPVLTQHIRKLNVGLM